jgi:hypothetical protein
LRRPTLPRLAVLGSALTVSCFYGVANAGAATVYDSIPDPPPGNVPSEAFEAQAASEFGDRVNLAGGDRIATSVTVLMSSWGCESGHWYSQDCVSSADATFLEPVTLNLYDVGTGGSVGSLIATTTHTFDIPYRPSASGSCGDGRWSDGTTCFNALAVPITFTLSPGVTLPDSVIVSVAFNTTHYGADPYGESTVCYASSAGCGYDALNVGLVTATTVGSDAAPLDAYVNSNWSGAYCDGSLPAGSFRLDSGCWAGLTPAVRIEATTCAIDDDPVSKRMTLLADCTTDHTLSIPDGYTLDGHGHTITAVDPDGAHFLGAVVANAGDSAGVTNIVITASGLADVCDAGDAALRGIFLHNAHGSITNVDVHGVRQGRSGCQEGNAIEVSNVGGTTEQHVSITGNTVSDYQKNAITVKGNVAAVVGGNVVTGDGPIDNIAQNGIQVSSGATADVSSNTISGNNYTPKAYVACGLLAFDAGGLHQSKNVFSGNEIDFCNAGRGGGKYSPEA